MIDGACPTVTVKTSSAATTEAALAKPDTTLPDVWLPDSSLWVQQLRSDIDGQDTDAQSMWVYPAVASSPLVLATTSANQAAASTLAQSGWAAVLASPERLDHRPDHLDRRAAERADRPVAAVGLGSSRPRMATTARARPAGST